MTTKYLDFDSTYRDRTIWPLPGEFEIPISQTGRKNIYTALDPVSTAFPIVSWSGRAFNKAAPGGVSVAATIINTGSSSGVYVISSATTGVFQKSGYYIGATVTNTSISSTRRIVNYTFIGTNSTVDKAEITTDSQFPDTFSIGNSLVINDPTDLATDIFNPIIFVPSISIYKYQGFYLYNETLSQYRIINSYDKNLSSAIVNTSNNPVSGWNGLDNFCIRKTLPSYLTQVVAPTFPVVNTTGSFYVNPIGVSIDLKGFFARVSASTNPITPPQTQCVRISNYVNNIGLITLDNNFSAIPVVGTNIEILEFSYDNLNPFIYNGSSVSQQETSCYEIKLTNLILPNQILDNAFGSRIAFYPYVYVELSNTNNNSAGNNIIYSNNPNTNKVLFRAAVTDVNNPLITAFVNLDSNTMVNTVKFKPNDTMKFSVKLSDGTIFKTLMPESYSPSIPNPLIQISACFSIKKI